MSLSLNAEGPGLAYLIGALLLLSYCVFLQFSRAWREKKGNAAKMKCNSRFSLVCKAQPQSPLPGSGSRYPGRAAQETPPQHCVKPIRSGSAAPVKMGWIDYDQQRSQAKQRQTKTTSQHTPACSRQKHSGQGLAIGKISATDECPHLHRLVNYGNGICDMRRQKQS